MSTLQIQDSFQPYYAGREEAEAAARAKPAVDVKPAGGKLAGKGQARKPPAPPRPKLGRSGQD